MVEFSQDESSFADIESTMKNLVVLFAGEISGFAIQNVAGGDSAFIRSLRAASEMSSKSSILVCAAKKRHNGAPVPDPKTLEKLTKDAGITVPVEFHIEDFWTSSLFFSVIDKAADGFEQVFIVHGDTPFLDKDFAARLYKRHCSYAAEYTFADGYPVGLAPDILARGIIPVLARLADSGPVTKTIVFDTIKKDINSFDIETDIAPVDVRHLRLMLACDCWQNYLLCESFADITVKNYAELVQNRGAALRTKPAFYGIQIAGGCPFSCMFCPYPAFCESGTGLSPAKAVTERRDYMAKKDFAPLIKKIADYSQTAVVSLSLWGEPSQHPEIAACIAEVLQYPGLSVLIETTGIGWKKETLSEIAETALKSGGRISGFPPITWIVSLDAAESGLYGALRSLESPEQVNALFSEAISCIEILATLFPQDVWPQFIRMNENEEQLEVFYRFWKEKLSRVIIQKYDSFCDIQPQRRVADLAPLKRHPCWHLKRDMSILIDGTVPLCREDLYASHSFGNAFSEDLADIWKGYHRVYEQHLACVYEGICGTCDEYYTYNF